MCVRSSSDGNLGVAEVRCTEGEADRRRALRIFSSPNFFSNMQYGFRTCTKSEVMLGVRARGWATAYHLQEHTAMPMYATATDESLRYTCKVSVPLVNLVETCIDHVPWMLRCMTPSLYTPCGAWGTAIAP